MVKNLIKITLLNQKDMSMIDTMTANLNLTIFGCKYKLHTINRTMSNSDRYGSNIIIEIKAPIRESNMTTKPFKNR